MNTLDYDEILSKLQNFFDKKNIQVDNLILVCLLILLIYENTSDLNLILTLFLLIF